MFGIYRKSKYKYVQNTRLNGKDYWTLNIKGSTRKKFKSERDAAIGADIHLILNGKEPVNILKPKRICF